MQVKGILNKGVVMFAVGTLIKVKTRTLKNVFGEVVWEVVDVGLPAPEPHRRGMRDGVKCIMLGGSGPAARKGYTVIDSENQIRKNIEEGITEIIPPEKRASVVAFYNNQAASSAGGIEV